MKLERVVLATANSGKIAEIKTILSEFGLQASSAREMGIDVAAEEKGRTYRENALAKARAVIALAKGLPVLADDSGLEVKALAGRPGVRSARYGGPGASDSDRIEALLAELQGVPGDERGAEFCCVAVLLFPDGRLIEGEGMVGGVIADSPGGERGFGYDPVFFYPLFGKTLAELSAGEKNRISHRALALRQLMQGVVLAGG